MPISISVLPEEMMLEILGQLDSSDLLRCRLVSRDWDTWARASACSLVLPRPCSDEKLARVLRTFPQARRLRLRGGEHLSAAGWRVAAAGGLQLDVAALDRLDEAAPLLLRLYDWAPRLARPLARLCLRLAPREPLHLLNAALLELRLDSPRAALALLEQALDPACHLADELRPGLLRARATARDRVGDAAGALADLRSLLELQPTATHWNQLGLQLYRGANYLEALQAFSRAREMAPTQPAHASNVAQALLMLDRTAEALEAFNAALALQPNDTDTHMWCGLALSRLKQYDEAIVHFDAALSQRPQDAHGYFLRGEALHSAGRRDEALADFDAALQLEPGEPFMSNSRGCLRRDMGRNTDALADFTAALKVHPTSGAFLYNRGLTYLRLGQPAEALNDLNRAAALIPSQAAVRYRRGTAFLLLGRAVEAEHEFNEALATPAQLARDLNAHGCILQRRGEHDAALERFNQALHLWPHSAEFLAARARSLAALGRLDQARADLIRARDLRHDDTEAAELLQQLQLQSHSVLPP